jgi:hypothetical protein
LDNCPKDIRRAIEQQRVNWKKFLFDQNFLEYIKGIPETNE